MPYREGQDIGGLGRLTEMKFRVAGEKRAESREYQNTQLFNMQMEANKRNAEEIQRGRDFTSVYMQSLSQAKPGEHYNVGTDFLTKYAETNPDNADLAFKAMQELDARQSDVLDDLRKDSPEAALRLANATIFKKHGIVAQSAGSDIEKGDLFEQFDSNTGKSLGIFYHDKATDQPKLYSKESLKGVDKKEPKIQMKVGLNPESKKWEHVNFVDGAAEFTGIEAKPPTNQTLSVGPDGTVTFSTGGQTKGRTKADQTYATEYVDYIAKGGHTDNTKLLTQLREAMTDLTAGGNITGPEIGLTPKKVLETVNPVAINVRERIEETVQRNLKAILGAQFTEKEGERLIARAFNPMLPEVMNERRLNLLISQMEQAAEIKRDAAQYWEKNGTLTGWEGSEYTMDDFDAIDFSQADREVMEHPADIQAILEKHGAK